MFFLLLHVLFHLPFYLLLSCLVFFSFVFSVSVVFLCLSLSVSVSASVWCCGRVVVVSRGVSRCVVLSCVMWCGVVCGVWCVVCVRPKRPRVSVQNVPVCTDTTRTCRNTFQKEGKTFFRPSDYLQTPKPRHPSHQYGSASSSPECSFPE